MDSLVLQDNGESPTLDPSPSSLNTMSPNEDNFGCPIALRKVLVLLEILILSIIFLAITD